MQQCQKDTQLEMLSVEGDVKLSPCLLYFKAEQGILSSVLANIYPVTNNTNRIIIICCLWQHTMYILPPVLHTSVILCLVDVQP